MGYRPAVRSPRACPAIFFCGTLAGICSAKLASRCRYLAVATFRLTFAEANIDGVRAHKL